MTLCVRGCGTGGASPRIALCRSSTRSGCVYRRQQRQNNNTYQPADGPFSTRLPRYLRNTTPQSHRHDLRLHHNLHPRHHLPMVQLHTPSSPPTPSSPSPSLAPPPSSSSFSLNALTHHLQPQDIHRPNPAPTRPNHVHHHPRLLPRPRHRHIHAPPSPLPTIPLCPSRGREQTRLVPRHAVRELGRAVREVRGVHGGAGQGRRDRD